ncbi:hypothetical protein BDA96_03G101700 [Sorghum bicolor]|uniref:Uncharacterized protein n=2 Tax=Sorghum bicolor TaxID=4558 RepID=A0A921RCN9_SORBI|nr:hypothetical protein BDA96_03G101700 [Sorghum bicolor]OQU86480.1 hypothetical protein SORBI_3003G096600 [Sorghum bicolor]
MGHRLGIIDLMLTATAPPRDLAPPSPAPPEPQLRQRPLPFVPHYQRWDTASSEMRHRLSLTVEDGRLIQASPYPACLPARPPAGCGSSCCSLDPLLLGTEKGRLPAI